MRNPAVLALAIVACVASGAASAADYEAKVIFNNRAGVEITADLDMVVTGITVAANGTWEHTISYFGQVNSKYTFYANAANKSCGTSVLVDTKNVGPGFSQLSCSLDLDKPAESKGIRCMVAIVSNAFSKNCQFTVYVNE